ncbi:hypothetical protein [Mesorhizobium xinjiangense]|nr:hypothetical protein [Mesorhizobium xinjiangense]
MAEKSNFNEQPGSPRQQPLKVDQAMVTLKAIIEVKRFFKVI